MRLTSSGMLMSAAIVLRPRSAAKVCQRAVRLPAAGLSLPKRLLMRERSSTTTGAGLCFEVHQEAAASIMAPCTSTSGVEDGSKARSRRWMIAGLMAARTSLVVPSQALSASRSTSPEPGSAVLSFALKSCQCAGRPSTESVLSTMTVVLTAGASDTERMER